MTLSRIIMVLSLAVLAFVLFSTINETEEALSNTVEQPKIERMANRPAKKVRFENEVEEQIENMTNNKPTPAPAPAHTVNSVTPDTNSNDEFETRELEEGFNYENFEPNPTTNDLGAAPVDEINDKLTDAEKEDDDLEIDGTDLLAAPLADRFHSLNSIANVNRNASNDLRGDIEIKYNEKYTPFYSSHIYGEPLHTNKLH